MVGVELAVGYLFAWAVRKARRVAGRMDAEVDQALDAGMDRLHEVVVSRLDAEPALEWLTEEADDGLPEPTRNTRRQLERALGDAAAQDTAFAGELRQAVEAVRAADPGRPGPTLSGNTFNGPTAVQLGDHGRQDNHFGSS
ncbi:hypothetical protein ABZW03_32740 [Kitasatospora sp. NPDC004799]|uniref:hypothetical protein n=1 Tax=Kitasatospora sp. NPDC004799 TaxID=3154460 RepID=UPI0033A4ADEB